MQMNVMPLEKCMNLFCNTRKKKRRQRPDCFTQQKGFGLHYMGNTTHKQKGHTERHRYIRIYFYIDLTPLTYYKFSVIDYFLAGCLLLCNTRTEFM